MGNKKSTATESRTGRNQVFEGLVVRNTGSRYAVLRDGTESVVMCAAKGNFRIKGLRTTNPVAVGDRVEVTMPAGEAEDSGNAFITKVFPRRNYIIRRASNLSKEAHILASNLDSAMLVVTLAQPTTSTTFIDRFLATAQAYGIEAVIVVNKIDLLEADDDRELLRAFKGLYELIGYKVIEVSAATGQGIDQLEECLKDKVTLLSGNSGVGKSSIINRLIPGLNLKTGRISDVHNTGMHTTTFSEMFRLPFGGWLIDTPGVKGFGTIEMDKREIDHFFPEIFEISHSCRYGDCSHTNEPGCAVREALDECRIAQSRYASYLSILEEAMAAQGDDKYRKAF